MEQKLFPSEQKLCSKGRVRNGVLGKQILIIVNKLCISPSVCLSRVKTLQMTSIYDKMRPVEENENNRKPATIELLFTLNLISASMDFDQVGITPCVKERV